MHGLEVNFSRKYVCQFLKGALFVLEVCIQDLHYKVNTVEKLYLRACKKALLHKTRTSLDMAWSGYFVSYSTCSVYYQNIM